MNSLQGEYFHQTIKKKIQQIFLRKLNYYLLMETYTEYRTGSPERQKGHHILVFHLTTRSAFMYFLLPWDVQFYLQKKTSWTFISGNNMDLCRKKEDLIYNTKALQPNFKQVCLEISPIAFNVILPNNSSISTI